MIKQCKHEGKIKSEKAELLVCNSVVSKQDLPQLFVVHVSLLQDLVHVLQQRVGLLVEESSQDAVLLQQVGSELLCLQSSEEKLEGLVEELRAEAQRRAAAAESLEAQLRAEAQRRTELTESLQEELRRWAHCRNHFKALEV